MKGLGRFDMKQTLWCCIGTDFKDGPNYDWTTLSYKRSDSIQKCVSNIWNTWAKLKSQGWKCKKVEVTINIIENENRLRNISRIVY